MKCDRYIELMSAGLDTEITDSERSDLQSHLNDCQECRKRSDIMRRQHESLCTRSLPAQPNRLKLSIKERIGIGKPDIPRATWHIGHIIEHPSISKISQTKLTPGPIMGPMGRA